MNPFLKHPILQFVGYDMMKRPTLEGIKADKKKVSESGRWSRVVFPVFILLNSIQLFYRSDFIVGIIVVVFSLFAYYTLSNEVQKKMKRFKISEEDILEQIKIHKEWNNKS
ncbi:MAG: hypothetical protein V3R52_04400 [Candidatus Neomarinimicrobiota bacterium]